MVLFLIASVSDIVSYFVFTRTCRQLGGGLLQLQGASLWWSAQSRSGGGSKVPRVRSPRDPPLASSPRDAWSPLMYKSSTALPLKGVELWRTARPHAEMSAWKSA